MLGSLNRGGAETLTFDVLKNAEKINLNLICIYRKDGSLYKDIKKTGVRLVKLRPNNLIDINYLVKLRTLFKKERISIIHTHQVIDAVISFIATIGLPLKIILTFHGHGNNDNFFSKILRAFIVKRTDMNLYVSQLLKKHYVAKYNFSTSGMQKCLYNGISFDKLSICNNEVSYRTNLDLPKDCILLGCVGNFTAVRDHKTICRFLVLLSKMGINYHFLFIGAKSKNEPWFYDDCKNLCSKNDLTKKVSFLGRRDDVPNILNQLDAFIYSSSHDTFGIAVVEAIAMGIPVFVNDWEVMMEITENGKYATVYKTKDENDLLEKFNDFLRNKQDYLLKARKSAAAVRKKYSIQNHLIKLEKIYNSIMAKK